jgi:tetratricopeptide (TPR) repeat protein
MIYQLVLTITLGVLLLAPGAAAKEKPWLEVRSPHFRVLTDGSESDARQIAAGFEQIRYVFATQFPTFRLESGAPLTVFAVRDRLTSEALLPRTKSVNGQRVAGEYFHDWEKQLVMVRLDDWAQEGRHVTYHEYTHSVIRMNTRWVPEWLNEGMAEFYGYSQFAPDKTFVGAASDRYEILRSRGEPVPIETLMQPTHGIGDDVFYAESWALVNFLMFGPEMENGKRLDHFFTLIQQGEEQKKAFQEVFGDFKPMDKALSNYMIQFKFPALLLPPAPKIEDKDFTARRLTSAETEAELAGFHVWTHDRKDARALAEEAVQDDPNLGLAHENMGYVFFGEGKDAEAETEFSKAYALDDKLYLSLFAKTMLSPIATSNAPADQTQFENALMKVLDLNRQFAPAYVELARLWLRRGNPKSALGNARRAEKLEPTRAGYHLLSGEIFLRLGDGATASDEAKLVAEHWFGPDHDEAVDLWNRIPPEQRRAGEIAPNDDETIFEEALKNTQVAEGIVQSVTCNALEETLALAILQDGKPLTFYPSHSHQPVHVGFSDTLWYGEDHFNRCHHLEGLRAIVRYTPAADRGHTGDIAELELRDNFPALVAATAAANSTPTVTDNPAPPKP